MAGSPYGQDIQGSCLLGFHCGCSLWLSVLESKGREKGAAGVLFEMLCRLCFSRSSLGPPDDLSSCSFEGPTRPRHPHQRRKHQPSSRQPPGVGPTKMATTYVTQSRGLWVPVPLSKPATAVNRRGTRAEATQRALTLKTGRGGKDCVVHEAPDSHRMATTNPSNQVGAWALYCCESAHWP